ncbi:MAG: STAS domain-containing protein [Proteobacteria bacterium]|nr:MAG: STAS domain-containing protein [Pseudomonadota bacterium]QKK12720.1 MAG: STAS domain-containing protein [Pseudomonadota bacterium]
MNGEFTPKLFSLIKAGIPRETILKDVMSGVIVGIVTLPLAIAFAIASGVSPEKGLLTAIVAGIVISVFGGSRVQIGGPTGAFIVIVYGIVQTHGVDGLIIATFMAGFIMMAFGLARFGNFLKFIPYSLIVGFTSGIAVIIFSSQINDFLGLQITDMPADFFARWSLYATHLNQVNVYAVVIAVTTVLLTLYLQKFIKLIPGSVVAIVLATLIVHLFNMPVQTIYSQFGEIPNALSMPSLPEMDFGIVKSLIQPAFAIALLGSIESLLSAVVADSMIGGKHRSNVELMAQGAANSASALFGGMPATGAIARTATNVNNGGRTPIAGIVHGVVLLLIMLLFAPLAKLIPLSCLAGILVVVAYHMSEWRQFKSILKGDKMDVIILLTTFFLTVLFDLVIAIQVGIVLSSFMFMNRMSQSVQIDNITMDQERVERLFEEETLDVPEGVVLYEINGPLFFGAARQFQHTLTSIPSSARVIILRMRYVPLIDATGFQTLKDIISNFHKQGIQVILSGVHAELAKDFERHGVYQVLDRQWVVKDIKQALRLVH